jgi:hypothetical protein
MQVVARAAHVTAADHQELVADEKAVEVALTDMSTLVALPVPLLETTIGTWFTCPGDSVGWPALNCSWTLPLKATVAYAPWVCDTDCGGLVVTTAPQEIVMGKV